MTEILITQRPRNSNDTSRDIYLAILRPLFSYKHMTFSDLQCSKVNTVQKLFSMSLLTQKKGLKYQNQ